MTTRYRPKDEPWPGGRGVYDWTVGRFVPVLSAVSAGVMLDRLAHERVQPGRTGSSAELCALYGGKGRGPEDE